MIAGREPPDGRCTNVVTFWVVIVFPRMDEGGVKAGPARVRHTRPSIPRP